MDYQYSKNYNPIGESGCAFITCGVWAEELAHKQLTKVQVNEVYAKLVNEEDMGWNCYIKYWDAVIDAFLEALDSNKRVLHIGSWNEGKPVNWFEGFTSEDMDFEILRVATPWGYHFKSPGFNPYPELTQERDINGRRYFKVI